MLQHKLFTICQLLFRKKERKLPGEFPDIYFHFKNEEFVVKWKQRTFNAVCIKL